MCALCLTILLRLAWECDKERTKQTWIATRLWHRCTQRRRRRRQWLWWWWWRRFSLYANLLSFAHRIPTFCHHMSISFPTWYFLPRSRHSIVFFFSLMISYAKSTQTIEAMKRNLFSKCIGVFFSLLCRVSKIHMKFWHLHYNFMKL